VAETMRAIHHEGATPLELREAPMPQPGPGQILIAVAAAGLNRPDLMQRQGAYPPPPGWPQTMGLEVSGTVAGLGPGAERWKVGDKVCALLGGGGHATHAVADAGSALPVPAGLSMEEAACLPETVFTVWVNAFEACKLAPGETLLVHGGASGIGTTAIQMAKAQGARVFATAGDAAKTALCEKLGAERGINYKSEDFEAVLRDAGGADVVLDMVGGPYFPKNLNLLKMDGRISMIATLEGMKSEVNLLTVMLKRAVLTGSTLRTRPSAEKARIAAAVEKTVWPWIAAGKLKPVIDRVFPIADAEGAHARLSGGQHAGKVALRV
jgi:NADPH2:quinone reductase